MNSLPPPIHTHAPTQLTSLVYTTRKHVHRDGATGDPSDNIIGAHHKNSGIIHVVPSDSLNLINQPPL